jgi:hypothetical protein
LGERIWLLLCPFCGHPLGRPGDEALVLGCDGRLGSAEGPGPLGDGDGSAVS